MRLVVFRPSAAADVEDAHGWYESKRAGLGEEFLAALAATVETIAANADAFPIVHRDVQRVLLRRFPYGLFYRVDGDKVVVVAVLHAGRDPSRWRSRG